MAHAIRGMAGSGQAVDAEIVYRIALPGICIVGTWAASVSKHEIAPIRSKNRATLNMNLRRCKEEERQADESVCNRVTPTMERCASSSITAFSRDYSDCYLAQPGGDSNWLSQTRSAYTGFGFSI